MGFISRELIFYLSLQRVQLSKVCHSELHLCPHGPVGVYFGNKPDALRERGDFDLGILAAILLLNDTLL